MTDSKGHLKKFFVLLFFVAGLEFLFLVSYAPFLHNHPLNQRETNNCPAFVIQTTLLTISPFGLLVQLLVFAFLILLLSLTEGRTPTTAQFSSQSPRSPPAFS